MKGTNYKNFTYTMILTGRYQATGSAVILNGNIF